MDDQTQKSDTESNWQFKTEAVAAEQPYDGMSESTGVPIPTLPTIEWTASEYIAHEKSPAWYFLLFGGGFLITLIIFVVTRDILASVVILLSFMVIAVYGSRKPEMRSYSVGEDGVKAGEKSFTYADFRSFSVVEEGAIDSIWLKPLKRYSPPVVMYFSPEDEERIVSILANFLPHEDRELDAVDRFSKRVRF